MIRSHASKHRLQLKEPYKKFKEQWDYDRVSRRKRLREELSESAAGKYKNVQELNQEIVNQEAKMEQEAIYDLIHETIEDRDVARELCSVMNSIGVIRETLNHYDLVRQNACTIYKNTLIREHSVLGKINEWVMLKVDRFRKKWMKEHSFEDTLLNLVDNLKGQEQFLFQRNLDIREMIDEQILIETNQVPIETFSWSFRIWSPKNWKITQNERGTYSVDKHSRFETTSSTPGWRFGNLFLRVGQYFWNGMFGTFANMIYGPFGLRSWIGLEDFQPDRTVDYHTGELKPTGSKYSTWFGRIKHLWHNIRQSRKEFEQAPEGGFFGKSFTRPFHLVWNYYFKVRKNWQFNCN